MPEFTGSALIFGKNSDREPNEAQSLERHLAREPVEKSLRVTFIEIPQARVTNEILISRPFHMWGAEMGANEHGLVLGNEAVFTRVPIAKKNQGLTGMDMLRLALERKNTAAQALEFITELLAEYSQDACGGYQDRNFFYHNSFIIADPTEAFVLETVGKEWAALRVKGFRSISNGLTIESEYDLSSPGLVEFALQQGYLKKGDDFNFRKVYSDKFFTYFSMCRARQELSMRRGKDFKQALGVADAMAILRTHGTADENFLPSGSGMDSLCLHASGLTTPSQTTGSLVASLRPGFSTYYFTGTAAPCLSVFKPFFFKGKALSSEGPPGESPDETLWWKHERLHRLVLRNYPELAGSIKKTFRALESEFIRKAENMQASSTEDRDAFSLQALAQAASATESLAKETEASPARRRFAPLYNLYRHRLDKSCKIA